MDPYDEQSLREEVLYLHSLWHKGPPRQQHLPKPPLHLHPSSSLHDLSIPPQLNKKRPRKNAREREYLKKAKDLHSDQEKEWPVNPTSTSSPASVSGWPTASSRSNSKTLLPSPEEQAKLAASRAQLNALNATKDFLSSDDYDDDDDDDDDDEYMDEDDDDLVEEKDGCKEYIFFYSLLMEDSGLKEYYLKNYPNGEFNCLVCGGTLKKYKDCVALVQHSNSIAKKRRRVHRAYGQAICKLLGWEIDKLPQIVSDLSATVNESMNKSSVGTGQTQETNAGETEESSSILVNDEASLGISSGEDIQKKISPDTENIPNNNEATQDEHQKKESADSGNMPNNGDSVISEDFNSETMIDNPMEVDRLYYFSNDNC